MKTVTDFFVVNGVWILVTAGCCALSIIFAEKIKRIPLIGKLLDVLQRAIG